MSKFKDIRKINHQYLLVACVLVLVVLCFLSVEQPLRFEKEQHRRELAVKRSLVMIRNAEERYLSRHGTYTGDFPALIRGGYLADSLQYIPYGNGRKFQLAASVSIGKSGRQIPLMECSAGYHDYLDGLDDNSIANLIEEANESGNFPGLKIGDISEPNGNAGNW